MKIVCIADTHTLHPEVQIPEGDLLIIAGDICSSGKMSEVAKFKAWLAGLPHRHKIIVAGNHDWPFERENEKARLILGKTTYLQDEGIVIRGINIHGTPWQPEFCNWAFNLPARSIELQKKWQQIPNETDILITHCPPYGILDHDMTGMGMGGGVPLGCGMLRNEIERRIKPKLHIFGHIHGGYGVKEVDGTTFVNACICTPFYAPDNEPIIVDFNEIIKNKVNS